ncbi:non-ribosomal peptide synthetase [Actinomadura sp. ATCC 39365]
MYSADRGDVEATLTSLTPAQRARLEKDLGLVAPRAANGSAAIRRRDGDHRVPLSSPQRRLWFLDQLNPGDPTYNCTYAFRLSGPVNANVLETAINRIVERHEALRTTFAEKNGEPYQVVHDTLEIRLTREDADAWHSHSVTEEAGIPFDLERGPLLRARILRLAERDHVLLLTLHHIVVDGWSMMVFFSELERWYDAGMEQYEPVLEPLSVQYPDFSAWQQTRQEAEQFAYWREALHGLTPLDLPTDGVAALLPDSAGAEHVAELPRDLVDDLRELCGSMGATLFMGLMTVFKVLLARYSGSRDIAIGAPMHGRTRPELEPLIGFFINTVVMRTDVSGDPTFRELLGRVMRTCVNAYENQEVPFERLVGELGSAGGRGASPLTRILMQITQRDDVLPRLAGVTAQRIDVPARTAKFDLLLDFRRHGDTFRCHVQHRTEVFSEAYVSRFMAHYVTLLRSLVAAPDGRALAAPMLTSAERERAVRDWNDTAVDFPRTSTLHGLFERRTAADPDALAVISGDRRVTYGELDRLANGLARRLEQAGVRRGDPVGLLLDRSADLVVGMLGVLKANAAYLPLDPAYPKARLDTMLAQVPVAAIVAGPERVGEGGIDVGADGSGAPTPPRPTAGPADLANVLFTSGSTGVPKGILLDHRGRVANVTDYNRRYGVGPEDRLFAISSPTFDMCTYDVFGTLAAGGTVVMQDAETSRDPKRWLKTLREERVTIWHSAPPLLGLLVDQAERDGTTLPDLRLVFLGGDWIPLSLPDRIRAIAPHATVVSAGGATEVSMDSTIYTVGEVDPAWKSIPYGRPMANQLAYVVDEAGEPAPECVPGALYLGGIGVGWGYHGRPALTAERFVPNPFSGVPGDRMYDTGDVARYGPDGLLELLGRSDFQVKIHGVRIELGEIEAQLRKSPDVVDAVVMAPGTIERRLIGYVLAAPGRTADPARLRTELTRALPQAMVPSAIVVLDRFPLTPNGKLDRRALPEPPTAQATAPSREMTDTERKVHDIWCRLLGHEEIGLEEDFFDLGGDSFLAIRAVREFHPDLPVAALFTSPTVAALAARADSEQPQQTPLLLPLRTSTAPRLTIVAVPYGGGNAISYQPLARALPDGVALTAVAIPGHDFTGQQLAEVADVAGQVVRELARTPGPIAVYGQCVGSALAVAIARGLVDAGRPPQAVFLGGSLVVRDPLAALARDESLSDDELAEFLGSLGGMDGDVLPLDRAEMLRLVRHDQRQAGRYFSAAPDAPLPVPAFCVLGGADPTTADDGAQRYRDWLRHFSSVRLEVLRDAGHYFIKDDASALADVLVRSMRSLSEERRPA